MEQGTENEKKEELIQEKNDRESETNENNETPQSSGEGVTSEEGEK